MKRGTRFLIQAAVIAGIYVVLTVLLIPFSYGVMQIRISEALTILPAFTPAAVPGLFVGCLVANLLSPYGIVDMICGSAATLLAAGASRCLRKRPLLVPLPPVIANGILVGGMLHYVYGLPLPLPLCIFWVALGEFLSCYVIGLPLLRCLSRYKSIFKI